MAMTGAPLVSRIRIGTAGWSLPAAVRDRFPAGESVLQRYAGVLGFVEINSSFHRPHRRATYARWAADTPDRFRFAVKAPRTITHVRRLMDVDDPLDRFLEEIGGLGGKLGPILIQLPPSLAFERQAAAGFFELWRERFEGETALEPRHAPWFEPNAEALMAEHRIARVAADPAPTPAASKPGGWAAFRYIRLHGSPVIYRSSYSEPFLQRLAEQTEPPAYVVFDNTMFGFATENALRLQELL